MKAGSPFGGREVHGTGMQAWRSRGMGLDRFSAAGRQTKKGIIKHQKTNNKKQKTGREKKKILVPTTFDEMVALIQMLGTTAVFARC